ncbi:guanylate-binding protein 1-like, partial [Ruditapes philippinarum]|uniref:guanylate-binding protein 1-like n=1 Tax=Ruditapes philippinarum TaxID=129788 RepID=UPI00295C24A8
MAEGGDDPSRNNVSVTNTSEEVPEERDKFTSLPVFQKPLCLVKNEVNGSFSIDENVLKQISQINRTVNVIAITGPCRTGKSYLMNRLAKNKHGFTLGNGVDAKTKGIWVWCLKHPVYTDQVMVLLDTEGIGDPDKKNQDNDYKLLCITTLICSTFIYNVKGVIDKDTLDKLGFVTFYAKKVSVSKDKRQNAFNADIGLYFPKFVLCLRDFSYNLGKESPNSYLERRLTLSYDEYRPDERDTYNQICACIRTFFPQRECFVFDAPVAGRVKLAKLESMGERELLESFKEDSDAFIEKITKYQPKILLDGSRINGNMFSSLVKTYVTTFNTGGIPCIDSALAIMSRHENRVAMENVMKKFQSRILSIKLPVYDEKNLQKLLTGERERAAEDFRKKCVLKIEKDLQDEIKKNMDNLCEEHYDKNIQIQKRMCISAMEEMYDSEIKPRLNVGHYEDEDGYLHYKKDVHNLKSKIKQRFPEMDDSLVNAILRELKDKYLEDDLAVMDMSDKSRKKIKEEHHREMIQSQIEFQRKHLEEKMKYKALNDEFKRQRDFEEQRNKIMSENIKKWQNDHAKLKEEMRKEQDRVEILLSLLNVEVTANEPTVQKSIARGAASLLPVIGPAIYDAIERRSYQKRKEELEGIRFMIDECKKKGDTLELRQLLLKESDEQS